MFLRKGTREPMQHRPRHRGIPNREEDTPMRRMLAAGGSLAAVFVIQASPALACGGLVAPDGDVRLDKATTFVAWHAGIEHYVTSFAYSGSVADLGWIV